MYTLDLRRSPSVAVPVALLFIVVAWELCALWLAAAATATSGLELRLWLLPRLLRPRWVLARRCIIADTDCE